MSVAVVVDSCVAMKWFIQEPGSDRAKGLLVAGMELIAPDLILLEIANGLWKHARANNIDATTVDRALANAPGYFQELQSSAQLVHEAAVLARALDHPIYDCLYVVVSRRTGRPLVTADRKLLAKLAGTADARLAVDLESWTPK